MRMEVTFSPFPSTFVVCDEVKISTFGRFRAFSCNTWSAFSVSANSNMVTFLQMPAKSMAASIPELPPPMTATCLLDRMVRRNADRKLRRVRCTLLRLPHSVCASWHPLNDHCRCGEHFAAYNGDTLLPALQFHLLYLPLLENLYRVVLYMGTECIGKLCSGSLWNRNKVFDVHSLFHLPTDTLGNDGNPQSFTG